MGGQLSTPCASCITRGPKDRLASPSFVVLVPYRDNGNGARALQLQRMMAYFVEVLPLMGGRLCVVEQGNDGQPFNRGQLLNAGFSTSVAQGSSWWPRPQVVIFHNVDMLPDETTLAVYASGVEAPVRVFNAAHQQCAAAGCFGGVVAVTSYSFESANGFPNSFWGKGENSAFQSRLRKAGFEWVQTIGEFEYLKDPSLDAKQFEAAASGSSAKGSKKQRERLMIDKRRWREDGLSSVEYSISSQHVLHREDVPWGLHVVVNLLAGGVRCGRCGVWQSESCFSKGQAFQRGASNKTACKLCLADEYKTTEANIALNDADAARRSCRDCGQVFSSRTQLFKHVSKCGTAANAIASSHSENGAHTCKPCLNQSASLIRVDRLVSAEKTSQIQDFVARLRKAAGELQTREACGTAPGSDALLKRILAQSLTFQSKPTNIVQIQSLLGCMVELIGETQPVVLELGAGKALFARALYELFHRQLPVVVLDNRSVCEGDRFYDPPQVGANDAPYTRVVADVRDEQWIESSRASGPTIAMTKHLCGGATDVSLVSVCSFRVDAICMAPCCHQKTAFTEYCNRAYLETTGFASAKDFETLTFLIQLSRHSELKDFEYRNRDILRLLPFEAVRSLGRLARRVVEEGRALYLRQRGYDVEVVRYVNEEVTPDNLVIMARRRHGFASEGTIQ